MSVLILKNSRLFKYTICIFFSLFFSNIAWGQTQLPIPYSNEVSSGASSKRENENKLPPPPLKSIQSNKPINYNSPKIIINNNNPKKNDSSSIPTSFVDPNLNCVLINTEEAYRECTLDFKPCKNFILIHDYYMSTQATYFGYTMISGKSDEKNRAKIEAEANALLNLAYKQGKDINIASFDKLEGDSEEKLKMLKARRALHVGVLAYLGGLYANWPASIKGKSCGPQPPQVDEEEEDPSEKPIIANFPMRAELEKLINKVVINLKILNDKIAELEKLKNTIVKSKQDYLNALSDRSPPSLDSAPTPVPLDCAKNPYLAGCSGRVGGSGSGSGASNWNGKRVNVPSPDNSIGGGVTGNNNGGNVGDSEQPAKASRSGGAAGAEDPGSGGAGSSGSGVSGGPGSGDAVAEDKSKEEDKSSLDLDGISDYGGKKKKGGGQGFGNVDFSGKDKKSKNPFEDLFGGKKNGDDDRGGIHHLNLRDIASANEAEDEEIGHSNIFSRITKTYIKKYSSGEVGNKSNDLK